MVRSELAGTPKGERTAGHVNWPERDAEIETAVRTEAARLLNDKGRPIRASETGVARRIGKLTVIRKNSEKLPLTIKALSEIAESVEDYAVRRVRWAAEHYREKSICPSDWKLLQRAAISPKIAKSLKVSDAIKEALMTLEPFRQNQERVRNFNVQETNAEDVIVGLKFSTLAPQRVQRQNVKSVT